MMKRFPPLLALGLAACGANPSAPPATPAPASASPAAPALPFIEDDYDRALAEARASHRPLFIDAWAPWCHTCLSMRAYTFRAPEVRARANELVWASIDTENPKNAAWVDAHPMRVWPTLYVVDPASGASVLEWPNAATADELVRLLDEARHAVAHDATPDESAQAFTAAAHGDRAGAIATWRAALAHAPADWPERGVTVESILEALHAAKAYGDCVDTADRELPKVTTGGARAATWALACASSLPAGDAKRAAVDRAVARARTLADDARSPMLPDDRSGLYEAIVDALDDDGRPEPAKAVARAWATYLEAEAAHAPDAQARAVFDAHRTDAWIALGQPEHVIPALEQSARETPNDYNVYARLARAYLAAKRLDEASASIDRAIALSYGPRAMRVLAIAADVREARGDKAGAIAAIDDALARGSRIHLSARYLALKAELEARRAKLQGTP